MRKEKQVTITAEGRDKGKCFLITEMSARKAEEWVVRAFLALQRSGTVVSDEAREAGAAAVLSEGIGSFMRVSPDDAMPLLDEMMECITIIPDPAKTDVVRKLIEDDIDEIATRFMLRAEVIELHTGFPVTAALSTLGAAAKRQMTSFDTPTSLNTSEPSSAAG